MCARLRLIYSGMRQRTNKAFTLVELTVTLILLSILVMVFAMIDLFSQAQVLTVDRRSKIQNDVTYCLEHSVKQISRAIGNTRINYSSSPGDGGAVIKTDDINGGRGIEFYRDTDANGKRDDDGSTPWSAYNFAPTSPTSYPNYLLYCYQCLNSACSSCNSDSWTANILSKKITDASYTYNPSGNYVEISVTGCWDPDQSKTHIACGASDKNPQVTMSTRVRLPAVSTQ